jgi:hypothetical protein
MPDQKPTLYDIGAEGIAINDVLFEALGELTPEIEQRLDELLAKGAQAMDAAAWVLRRLAGEAETCKLEAERYKARQKALEGNQEALKNRMVFAVDAAFGGKLKTSRNTIWAQNAAPHVSIELATDIDPETALQVIQRENSCLIRQKLELNKTEIRNRYEAGEPIPSEIVIAELPGTRYLRFK